MRHLPAVLLVSIVALLGALPVNHEAAQASSHPPPVSIAYEGMTFPAPVGGAFEGFSSADVFAVFPSWLGSTARYDLDASGTVSAGDVFRIFPWWLATCT